VEERSKMMKSAILEVKREVRLHPASMVIRRKANG
jgi:hypothetical protein